MNKILSLKYLPYILIPIAINTIEGAATFPIGNTFIWWFVEIFILLLLWKAKKIFYNNDNDRVVVFLNVFLIYILLSFFHGMFMAKIYWDWKALLSNTMSLLLPVIIYVSTDEKLVQIWLNKYLKYALPLFVLFAPFIWKSTYGEYLMPFTLLIFFTPVLKFRHQIFVLGISAFAVLVNFSARSIFIKFSLPVLLLSIFYLKAIIPSFLMGIVRWVLLFVPIVLLVLAVSGVFNPFAMDEYIEKDYKETRVGRDGQEVEEDLTADTRTFIYAEVLLSAKNHNSWIFGRSPARGYDTEAFGDWTEGITGRRERISCEVSVLNIFTWLGLVGVVLYFLVLFSASFFALAFSRNIFVKMLGLYLSFRWTYAWVEDYTSFNLNNAILYIMIGLCLSKSFRAMNNSEVKEWAREIFNMKYKIQ